MKSPAGALDRDMARQTPSLLSRNLHSAADVLSCMPTTSHMGLHRYWRVGRERSSGAVTGATCLCLISRWPPVVSKRMAGGCSPTDPWEPPPHGFEKPHISAPKTPPPHGELALLWVQPPSPQWRRGWLETAALIRGSKQDFLQGFLNTEQQREHGLLSNFVRNKEQGLLPSMKGQPCLYLIQRLAL